MHVDEPISSGEASRRRAGPQSMRTTWCWGEWLGLAPQWAKSCFVKEDWDVWGRGSYPSLVCWRNIDVRFLSAQDLRHSCCFVGAQLEGIILVTACVFGFDTGADCRAGCSVGRASGVQLSQRQYASVEVKIVPKVANHGDWRSFYWNHNNKCKENGNICMVRGSLPAGPPVLQYDTSTLKYRCCFNCISIYK